MKTPLVLFFSFLLSLAVIGQDARYETATGTNSITIQDYESGELISVLSTNQGGGSPDPTCVIVKKDNLLFTLKAAASNFVGGNDPATSSAMGDTVRGAAVFSIRPIYASSAQGFTIKITPVSFPPNQTLIVPPGTNQVQISMEGSTNLVNWAVATNGVYGSPDSAYFFRMRMTKLQP